MPSTGRSLRSSLLLRALVGLAVLVTGTAAGAWLLHASLDGEGPAAGIVTGAIAKNPLAGVRSWSPTDDTPGALAADLLAIDVATLVRRTGLSAQAIEALQRRADGSDRVLLARIRIATADLGLLEWLPSGFSGRGAGWLGDPAPGKPGFRQVRYWQSDWQDLLSGSSSALVDRLAVAGVDGIYIADAGAYTAARKGRPSAEKDLVDLVARLATRGKAINPDFVVVLANGEELIMHPALGTAVDAVAKEDLLFGAEEPGRANPRAAVVASLQFLKRARREGRPVLVSESLDAPQDIAEATRELAAQGFVGSIAPLSARARPPID
ncbi:MAG: hypothetical protein ACOYLQ_00080 [Hyphomicrobiaceae bacterium]